MLIRLVFIAAALSAAVACAPKNVVAIANPDALQQFCDAKRVARLTAVQNILTSLKDGDPKPSTQTYARMMANAKAQTGLEATWKEAMIIMPKDAQAFGESDQYMRAKRVVIANVPEGADPPRPIDVEVRDHGTYRWYSFQAYDTQNVCVEGQRAF